MIVIAAHNRSLGKGMFWHLCVILFKGGLASQHASQVTWVCIQGEVCLQEGLLPGGVCLQGCQHPEGLGRHGILRYMPNKRAVRILLECFHIYQKSTYRSINSFYCLSYNSVWCDNELVNTDRPEAFIQCLRVGRTLYF